MIKLGLTVPGFNQDDLRAHDHCRENREELSRSTTCGCFYCFAMYSPSEITEWIDGDQTAMCARCGIDSVVPLAAGYPITVEFLQKMHDHWSSTRE
jgi:hypothetical protein